MRTCRAAYSKKGQPFEPGSLELVYELTRGRPDNSADLLAAGADSLKQNGKKRLAGFIARGRVFADFFYDRRKDGF